MEFVQTTKDFITSKEWTDLTLDCVKILRLAQQVSSYGSNFESMVRSRSHIKVIRKGHCVVESSVCLLFFNKHKKFEDEAIARFCCNIDTSQGRTKTQPNKQKTRQPHQYQYRLRWVSPAITTFYSQDVFIRRV